MRHGARLLYLVDRFGGLVNWYGLLSSVIAEYPPIGIIEVLAFPPYWNSHEFPLRPNSHFYGFLVYSRWLAE